MTASFEIPANIVQRFKDTLVYRAVPPLVFATLSGSHMFGFPSVDSDYDIRGMHVEPGEKFLGLDNPVNTIETLDAEFDFVSHEAKKFLLLLCKNGNALEQVWSPYVVHTTPAHDRLKELSLRCVTRSHAAHYFGFADAQRHMFEQRKVYEIKPILYTYRIYMAGIYLLKHREVVSDLTVLNKLHLLGAVDQLIAEKLKGEHVVARESQMERFRADIDGLRKAMQVAEQQNPLPDKVPDDTRAELNDFLMQLRGKP
jgi:uncharacterized protein